MPDPLSPLSPAQRDLLARWLPDLEVVADHSWGLVETRVLEVRSGGRRLVVKAGGPSDGHIGREVRAHREWLEPWVRTGHASRLVVASAEDKLVVTEFLPGVLVEGTAAQDDPDTYLQAGRLLARFHGQLSQVDPEWHDRFRARVVTFLDRPHRIEPAVEARIREEVATWPVGPATVVPTHGDWQPRNWLVDGGTVRVIDFGRADLRPRTEDFGRLGRQDFTRDPALEDAFLEGYGDDPREPDSWRRECIAEGVGTAVWAFGVGDEPFEAVGHAVLASYFPAASDT